ncbi:hypothetical protein RHMOL_Rhmol01G0105300 [Rhododendron molle]|uniref:Uncharacterized protein n=1 Tax=Rhododendron molle TaxID=49168 RepID=A0ACC0Q2Z8_RHOML|nr:hypothetical protein RHMOL_Rhmol01G0105300 [Rhododendron molle]
MHTNQGRLSLSLARSIPEWLYSKAAAFHVRISKKKRKAARRMKVSELKKTSLRPDLVEVWDVTAADPKLLVFLKSYQNSVPVPRHWSQKRNYLHGKRGIEKTPFRLPDFTGIDKIREGYVQKQEKLKQKQRERMMRPKMRRTDIDYRVLHDALKTNKILGKFSSIDSQYLVQMRKRTIYTNYS